MVAEDSRYERLTQVLEAALQALHDPTGLARSGLADWLGLAPEMRSPIRLQNLVADALQALRPACSVPSDTPAWRYYHILNQRYLEHLSTDEIARNLSVSGRHVRRLHPQAIEALANQLIATYGVHPPDDSAEPSQDAVEGLTREQELHLVSQALGGKPTPLDQVLQSVLTIVAPLADHKGILIEKETPATAVPLVSQAAPLRHALLTVLSELLNDLERAPLQLYTAVRGDSIAVCMHANAAGPMTARLGDAVTVAADLIRVAGGELQVQAGSEAGWTFCFTVPAAGQVPVLIIDDNADALRLFERHLNGTRYRMVGLSDPADVVSTAMTAQPAAILLDLMLPGMDGWELLGHLREQPALCRIPVFVCSILPQEELATALGAAGFLRKPVSRDALLQILDDLPASPRPIS